MIPIVYFRSSSFNCHRMCPMQYYVEYVLGIRGPSNKAADKGTITHKVLEICALCAKAKQEGKTHIIDDILGKVEVDNKDPNYLASIISNIYRYYSTQFTHHKWTEKDFSDISSWVWKALKYKNGMFDPRSRIIVDAEPFFDFEIKKDWAKINYPEYNIDGYLSLKGTIDLITKLDDGIYEIIDWKGLPLDTPLVTPTGWTTMRDVQVGDMLIDMYGQPTTVIGKSTAKYNDCIKITFNKNMSVVCDKEHRWQTTDNIVKKATELKVGDVIPRAWPLQLHSQPWKLPIDPYKLGKMLGMHKIGNKRIPKIYLRSSEQVRLALYHGIKHSPFYNNFSDELLQQIYELECSLGDIVSSGNLTITSIEKSIAQKTQCVEVSSPSKTYLCTEHMIVTHNSGRRLDWATGEVKTQEKLFHDPQLRLYHYAVKHLYPDISTFLITIFFINDGGPFTVQFLDSDLKETERIIRERFEEIRDTEHPSRIKETNPDDKWKCYRLCHAGKTTFRNSHVNPEFYPSGDEMNMCDQINRKIKQHGIDWVTQNYKHPDHVLGKYKAPGSVE